jgi:hypothetical protein
MDDYNRKTAGMIGALLFAFGLFMMAIAVLERGRLIFEYSLIILFSIIIGAVLLSEVDKIGKKEK